MVFKVRTKVDAPSAPDTELFFVDIRYKFVGTIDGHYGYLRILIFWLSTKAKLDMKRNAVILHPHLTSPLKGEEQGLPPLVGGIEGGGKIRIFFLTWFFRIARFYI
jgi:hypothetical protein